MRGLVLAILLVLSTPLQADTFIDLFDVRAYSNQDGTETWTNDWAETNDDGSATAGDILITTGGEMRIRNASRRLTRPLDLSGYDLAKVTFDYREVGYGRRAEVSLEIRSASTGWTRIVRYRGRNVNNGSGSFDIPVANLEAGVQIRWNTGNRNDAGDEFFVDNFTITALSSAGDFVDRFNVAQYSNQDGSLFFDADWLGGGSPTGGDVQIIAGDLRLANRNVAFSRSLNLSGYSAAELTFDYAEVFDGRRDEVFVEVRSGFAGAWTELARYRGRNVNTGSASLSIPAANLAADTEVRFRTGRRNGNTDYFYVDDFIITVYPGIGVVVDHFDVSFTGGTFGINCVPHAVRVTAHDNLHGTMTSYTGEIQLATDTAAGDWSDGGLGNLGAVANGAAGDGIATYQYQAGDVGEADFFLDYTNGTDNLVGIDVNDTATVSIVDDSVASIQFAPTGFTLTASSLSNPPPNPINDPVLTQVAGTDFFIHLAAYGQTPTDAACGVIEAYTGNHDLHFWVDFDNPISGTVVPTVNGQPILNDECLVPGPPNCNDITSTHTVGFLNGQAFVTAKYKDVGSILISAKDDDYEISQSHTITIPGSTSPFVVQPDNFVITTIESGAAVANPGTTSGGSGFVAAGESFRVVVEVRDAENSLVPNYGNEVPPESVRLTVSGITYPAGGNPGSLTNSANFSATATNGEFENTTVSWTEVGTMNLAAGVQSLNYLGTGDVVGTATGNVGRFYPYEFALTSSSVTNSCAAGLVTYMSEPAIDIGYTVEARNLSGAVTVNYDNTDLAYSVSLPTYHAEDSNDGTDRTGRLSIPSGQWDDGSLDLTTTSASFNRSGAPDGPYTSLQIGLKISEPDGADFAALNFKPADNNDCLTDGDCTGASLTGLLNVGFGRMRLANAFGPELAAIPMTWQTETWNGSQFTLNTNDQCTQLPIADVNFIGAATAVDAAADTISLTIGAATSVFSFADPLGASDCLTAAQIGFCNGKAGVQYGQPGMIVTYPVSVDLTNLPHLRFDWDQDGTHNDVNHPLINVDFQSYRGHDRVIYWQETLQ